MGKRNLGEAFLQESGSPTKELGNDEMPASRPTDSGDDSGENGDDGVAKDITPQGSVRSVLLIQPCGSVCVYLRFIFADGPAAASYPFACR